LKVARLRRAEPDEYEDRDFIPTTPYDIDEMFEKLVVLLDTIQDRHLKALMTRILADETLMDRFKCSIAAHEIHHSYVGGLLEHTLSVMEICDFFAGHYPNVNRDLLLALAFLHDLGKAIELDSVETFDYTVEGRLKGHIVITEEIVRDAIKEIDDFPEQLELLVEHLILAHQGKKEWSSPVEPLTVEAILLHYADDADAKRFIVANSIDKDLNAEDVFTARNYWMGGRRFYKGRYESQMEEEDN